MEEEEEEGHNVSHHDPNIGFDALFIPRPTAHMLNCPNVLALLESESGWMHLA